MTPNTGIPPAPAPLDQTRAPEPGTPVTVPMASNQTAGTIVAAAVAPASGPIPANVDAVVVPVKPWWQSSEIVTSIVVILGAGMDSMVNGVLPLLDSSEPVDMAKIKAALIRSFLMGVFAAFVGIRRKLSNSAVR